MNEYESLKESDRCDQWFWFYSQNRGFRYLWTGLYSFLLVKLIDIYSFLHTSIRWSDCMSIDWILKINLAFYVQINSIWGADSFSACGGSAGQLGVWGNGGCLLHGSHVVGGRIAHCWRAVKSWFAQHHRCRYTLTSNVWIYTDLNVNIFIFHKNGKTNGWSLLLTLQKECYSGNFSSGQDLETGQEVWESMFLVGQISLET